MSAPVYAPEASAVFNEWLHRQLQLLGSELEDSIPKCRAVVLGGGYGRGDGGVALDQDGRERPYNDLDLFAVSDLGESADMREANMICHDWSQRIGIEVDLGAPLAPADLRKLPEYLMWIDLYQGHRVLAGQDDIIRKGSPQLANISPAALEGSKLLLNRGAGLLLAALAQKGHDALLDVTIDDDFLFRNVQKAYLAIGDSLLITAKAYRSLSSEKLTMLHALQMPSEISKPDELINRIEDAVRFKLLPRSLPRPLDASAAVSLLAEVAGDWLEVFLAIERRRLATEWRTADEACRDNRLREPDLSSWRAIPSNLLRNLRLGRLGLRYPREILFRLIPTAIFSLAHDATGLPRPDPSLPLSRLHDLNRLFTIWKRYN